MFYLLFILIWFFYYISKGIIPFSKIPKTIVIIFSAGLWGLLFYFAQNFHVIPKVIALFYLILSGINYFLFVCEFRPLTFKLFSGVFLTTEDLKISYFIFKPIILIPADLFLWFKKFPIIGFGDAIEINVKSKKEKTDIFINL